MGLKTTSLINEGHVASCGASDLQRDDRVASIAWTRGPRDQDFNTWLKFLLSELIATVDHKFGRFRSHAIDGLLETSLLLDQNPTDDQVKASLHRGISIVHQKSDGHHAKTPIHQKTHNLDR